MLAAAPGKGLQTRDLVSTYFDTPEGALSRNHMSLRLRQGGGGPPVQTFKAGQGLSRQELEWPAPAGLDLNHRNLKAILKPALRKALTEAFTVAIHRRQRTFDFGGARIELALDEGEARRGAQKRPICEVELELKSGSPEVLFDLARSLSRVAPLRLSFLGKASQGQMLVQATPSFSQPTFLTLNRDTRPGDAFQALARRAFVDLALHAEAYSEHGGARSLHALRVSTRRLKSYLSTFRALLDEDGAKAARGQLTWLLEACGEARNIDVLAQTYLSATAPAALAEAVKGATLSAHARTQGALASGRFRELLLDLAAWVETEAWMGRTDAAGEALGNRIRPFARRGLTKNLQALNKRAGDLRTLDPEARHEVRLKVKRLRYVLEAFVPLFSAEGAARYLKTLREIQSDLGDLNDVAVAGRLVEGLPQEDARGVGRELVTARAALLERRLPIANRKLQRLLAQAPPWST